MGVPKVSPALLILWHKLGRLNVMDGAGCRINFKLYNLFINAVFFCVVAEVLIKEFTGIG
jgi:hypothetical protein